MISKELLSEVLGIKYSFKIEDYNESNLNNLEWWQNEIYKEQMHTINIYELAHKCKEWAFNNGYELRNGRDIDVKEEICYFCEYKQERQLDYLNGDYFLAETEPKSIFKACQWILENKVSK